ncbi:permease [Alkaliphilus transvaalensis]|uniref:permease n=1 Tax=Alkaliphilus transvaalensis TaxID=114628 RepID=UPI0004796D95|nr:permease [Alkaliphilus transvaalensis]
MFEKIGHLITPPIVNFINWLLSKTGSTYQMGETFYEAVHFFIYDTIKIIFLLSFMIFMITFVRSYFPPEKIKKLLSKLHGIWSYIAASILGVVSPFCSCSTVPIFIGFVEAKIPLGVTFTFLVTSPIVNEIALGYLFIAFGPKIALFYTLAGMTIGVITGIVIEKSNLSHLVEAYVFKIRIPDTESATMKTRQRLLYARDSVIDIVKEIWPYIVAGIAFGALIHGYAPETFLIKYAGPNNPFAVIVGIILGIPLYSNAVGTIPVVEALINKGVGVGTALAFMMSVVAMSIPSIIMLKKVIKPKLITIFIGITALGILTMGLIFNIIL